VRLRHERERWQAFLGVFMSLLAGRCGPCKVTSIGWRLVPVPDALTREFHSIACPGDLLPDSPPVRR